jgi:F-box and leucine-rich repeat protein 2/20
MFTCVMHVCRSWNTLACESKTWTHLDLSAPHFQRAMTAVQLALQCHMWHDLESIRLVNSRITDEALMHLLTYNSHTLESISLHSCNAFTNQLLTHIGAFASSALKQLRLVACAHLTNIGAKHLALCSKLQHLEISYSSDLGDAALRYVAFGCPQLRFLASCGCHRVSDAGVASIAQHCAQLEHIELQECKITDTALTALGAGCPKLNYIVTTSGEITDDGVMALSAGCPDLSHVAIRTNSRITDSALALLAMSANTNLQHLELPWDILIGDQCLAALGQYCPNLESLNIHRCSKITDAGIHALVTGTPKLRDLNIDHCHLLTDVSLRTIVQLCPELQRLSAFACYKLTRVGLQCVPPHVSVRQDFIT